MTAVAATGVSLSAQTQQKVSSSTVAHKVIVSAASQKAPTLRGKGSPVMSPFAQALPKAPALALPAMNPGRIAGDYP